MQPGCYKQNYFKNLNLNFKEEEISLKEKNPQVCYIQIMSFAEEVTSRISFILVTWKHFQHALKNVHTLISS